MLSLPFALVGGVWIMWLLDYNLSIAVAVGFIALAGVAAETGVVMLIYLDHAWEAVSRGGRRPTLAELVGVIEHGAVNRVRPKLMTVLAIMLGLVPALWRQGGAGRGERGARCRSEGSALGRHPAPRPRGLYRGGVGASTPHRRSARRERRGDRAHSAFVDRDAPPGPSEATRGGESREPGIAGRRARDHRLRLAVGDDSHRSGPERGARLVVGRSGGCPGDASADRARGRRGREGGGSR